MYYISNIHYQYWLNLDLPIILILYIESEDQLYWENIIAKNIQKTEKQWKIEIPKLNILNVDAKTQLEKILSSENKGEFVRQFLSGKITEEKTQEILNGSLQLTASAEHIANLSQILKDCSSGLSKYTAKLKIYGRKGLTDKSRDVKRVIQDCSRFIKEIALKLEQELELFTPKFIEGFSSHEKISMALFELTDDYQDLEKTYNSIKQLPPNVDFCIHEIKLLKKEVSKLPTKYNTLANARKQYIETCNRVIKEFKIVNNMSFEFLAWLNHRIN